MVETEACTPRWLVFTIVFTCCLSNEREIGCQVEEKVAVLIWRVADPRSLRHTS